MTSDVGGMDGGEGKGLDGWLWRPFLGFIGHIVIVVDAGGTRALLLLLGCLLARPIYLLLSCVQQYVPNVGTYHTVAHVL